MKKHIITLIIITCLAGCINKNRIQIPVNVKVVIDSSGSNRTDLMITISEYMHQPDSLKLLAAYFLIENMREKYFSTYLLYDTNDSIIDYNISDYNNYQNLIKGLNSIQDSRGVVCFKNHYIGYDYYKVTSEFLIHNIELSFWAREHFPWAKQPNNNQFIEYVLPYRNSNEKLEDFREYLIQDYAWLSDSMQGDDDPVKAAEHINDELISWFKMDNRYLFNPTDQGISEMLEDSIGREEDFSTLFCTVCRAMGIAVAMDFTPYWPEDTLNSAWNVIFDKQGKSHPMKAFTSGKNKFTLEKKPAKVYRMTYKIQSDELKKHESNRKNIPPFLHFNNLIDVTADYTEVSDITISLLESDKEYKTLYLCVWNSNQWNPICWSKIKDNTAHFENLGRGIRYMPAFYRNDSVIPAANQCYINANGSIEILDTPLLIENDIIIHEPGNISFLKNQQ
ncbi:MAG: transglutaminase domain-containing protein [Bacteroidales bacterium]|nr:transglutaminase domain-containing protein [Bacteroidales bacterium]